MVVKGCCYASPTSFTEPEATVVCTYLATALKGVSWKPADAVPCRSNGHTKHRPRHNKCERDQLLATCRSDKEKHFILHNRLLITFDHKRRDFKCCRCTSRHACTLVSIPPVQRTRRGSRPHTRSHCHFYTRPPIPLRKYSSVVPADATTNLPPPAT